MFSLNFNSLPINLIAVLGLSGAAACTKANPVSCLDGHCSDPALPFCDVDGTLSGTAGTCVAVSCTPGEFLECREDRALSCSTSGDTYDMLACKYGCGDDAAGCLPCPLTPKECAPQIIPKYLPEICNNPASAAALTIGAATTLNTSDDASCNGGVVAQTNAPDICVLRYDTVTIERNHTLTVTGSRALAIVADGQLLVDGVLDLSANGHQNGPGGGFLQSGLAGGGAGFKTAGANGGTATLDGGANNGGAATENPALHTELAGGTSTPQGLFSDSSSGGAGGAATLISCRGAVSILGVVDAGGGGGSGAFYSTFFTALAGGGGSGGHVVLQGMTVMVTGQVYANGGGGGGGAGTSRQMGGPGGDGSRSATSASAGGTSTTGGGNGGQGGTATSLPTVGKMPSATDVYALSTSGGGGASVGFFQTYTPSGVSPVLTPFAASPDFEMNRNVPTR